jgi:O-antigen/teichoic acid export membrane protein
MAATTQAIMLKDKFITGSAILFVAMMAGNVFGYLFQLTMGRMLSIEAYGEMNALMSLMVLFALPFSTLLNFFARQTAIYVSSNRLYKIRGLHRFGLIQTCKAIVPVLCCLGLLSSIIGNYLDVGFDLVLIVLVSVLLTALVTINTGVIQGMQRFRSLSFISAGTSIFKFAFAVLFVAIGWGVRGALGGLVATGLVLWGVSQWLILSYLPKQKQNFVISFNEIYRYIGGLFFANSFFAVMTQADIMLVKHYFPAQEAGFYASSAILGKAVMYLPGAIVMALFPMVAANQAEGKTSGSMLVKAICLTLVLSGTGALILFFFPGQIIGVLFGERYLPASPIASIFGVAMLPMALVLLVMNFLLAQGRTDFVYFLALSAVLEILGIHLYRHNLTNILYVIMTTGYISLIPMFAVIFRTRNSIGEETARYDHR